MNKDYFIDKLSKTRQSNFAIYNYDCLPETFLSHDKIPIVCNKHGLFYQKTCSHLFGQGCSICSVERVAASKLIGTDAFVERSKSKFGNKFGYTYTIYIKQDNELTITCPEHGNINISPRTHMQSKNGCTKCDYEIPRRIKQQKFIEQAKEIHGNKYNYSKVIFINTTDAVEIICSIHGSFWQSPDIHINDRCDCPKCMREADKLSQDDFIAKSKILHGDNYNYDKIVYETNTSMVTITCKKHGDFIQRAASHLTGCGCKICKREEQKHTTDQFIEKAILIHGNKYDYSKVNYKGNKIPVEILCSIHGSFWQKPNSHISGKQCGCRLCSESKGEILIESILKKYNINHIREYRLLPYLYRCDFYLPELNIFIEFNGLQHYSPVDFFGGEKGFHITKENDCFKKDIIKNNNGKLIIITYLHLNENDVENELIRGLKRAYKYWFVVNGKLQVFKGPLDVCAAFNLPMNILVKDIVSELEKTIKDFHVLF